jgi:hypothetical protein
VSCRHRLSRLCGKIKAAVKIDRGKSVEYVSRDEIAGHDDHQEAHEDPFEIFLDRHAHGFAEEIDQRRHTHESDAARDHRQHEEERQIHAGKAGSDGDDLVGNGRDWFRAEFGYRDFAKKTKRRLKSTAENQWNTYRAMK